MEFIGKKTKIEEVTEINKKIYLPLYVKLLVSTVSLSILVFSAWAIFYLLRINTNYSISAFFPNQHELLHREQKTKLEFQISDQSPLIVVLKKKALSPHWLDPKSLQELKKITQSIKKWKNVSHTLSLANIEGAIEKNQELLIGEIFDQLPPREWVDFTKKSGAIYPQLISTDLRATIVIVNLKNPSLTEVDRFISHIRYHLKKQWPQLEVEIGGTPAVQSSFAQALFIELRQLLLLSVTLFCGIFYFFIRGWRSLIFTGVLLICANLMALGTVGFLQIPFSVIMSTLPIIVSITVVSLVIHTLHRWAEVVLQVPNDPIKRYAFSWHTLKEMFLPNFLGSITTAIGFFTLTFTDSPLISQYGFTVAFAVLGAWAFTQIALLVYMPFLQPRMSSVFLKKSTWTLSILKYKRPIFISAMVGTLLFVLLGTQANFSTRLFDDLPESNSARRATEFIDDQFGGIVPLDVSLKSKQNGYWLNPKSLKKLDSIIEQFRKKQGIGSVVSASDFLGEKTPKTKAAAAETQFLYSMAENDPLKNYLTLDGRSIRLSVRFKDRPSNEIEHLRKSLRRSLKNAFPNLAIQESGFAVTSHEINRKLAFGLVSGFWHSIAIVGLLLIFVFRSIRWAIVACIPNIIPPAVLLGSLAVFQTPIKPGVALIFSIALGLAFNNTVYFLSRLKKLIDEKKLSYLPIRRALLQEGNPCMFETSIMLCGFLFFIFSSFSANRIFGTYMIISIVAGAIADLFFLPSLLKAFPKLLISPKKVSPAVNQTDVPRNIPTAASVAMALLFLTASQRSHAELKGSPAEQARSILSKTQKLLAAKDDQAHLQMKIIEANGTTQVKKVYLESLRDESVYLLAKILAPADIKNTAFLAQMIDGEESQWLYLPSSGQVRRIVSSKKTTGVLGSELTTEDLNPAAIKGARVQLVKTTNDFYFIETIPPKGATRYSKAVLAISKRNFLPIKTNYYMQAKIAKTVEFMNYKEVRNQIWRAQKIVIKNWNNKRGTELKFSKFKVNAGLSRDDFSVQRLKDLD